MIKKPTAAELKEWEDKLAAEGFTNPDQDLRFPGFHRVGLTDATAAEGPAEAVRDGGTRFRNRSYYYSVRQSHNKKRQPVRHVCLACGCNFGATKRAKYCSRRCQMRELMRARRVSAKVRNVNEGE